MVRTVIQEAICPACGGQGLEYTAEQVDLPYMGSSLETMLRCDRCGYRHTDFILTERREPTRYSYRVTKADDMMVRVVRSASGTIRIPELGILIEPGVASEAFVSNIEGILVRVERVLDQLHRDAEDAGQLARIEELQGTLQAMRDGTAQPVTVVLEDPFGNSAILGEGAEKEAIPQHEADLLAVGMVVLDPDGNPWTGDRPGPGGAAAP
ncbi:MAG TPA: ZPR1 zinc finger domain-containing protein [Candidatus Thermoplasmatota archaeon]|nr:ZPR1 zinc finger domain-containing protein [Candidatus Thermoplasmatota archaeon]